MGKTQSVPGRVRVKDIVSGSDVRSLFLIGSAARRKARNGLPYWQLDLKDASASIEGKIWSPLSQQYDSIPAGSVAEVEGRVEIFQERLQLNISALRPLAPEELAAVDISQFMPASERPAQDMYADLLALCKKELTHKPWRKFILGVLGDKTIRSGLMTAPAATSVHHAWAGGLLEHTLSVATLCMRLCDHYPTLDRQTLLAGAVCHDLGKIWEQSGGLSNSYTDEGSLIGHIVLALEKLERPLVKSGLETKLVTHFKHLVLSHHGQHEYGSPQLPKTAEAFALHHADDLDATLTHIRGLFTELPEEEAGWPHQKSIKGAIYRTPRTPEVQGKPAPKTKAESPKKPESPRFDQCSLL